MKTLTQNELAQVAGGDGPHGAYGKASISGYDFGTSGSYVFDKYYRESLNFEYNNYGSQYGAEYGHFVIPHVPHYKGHGY